MKFSLMYLLVLVCSICCRAEALRVLGIFPTPAKGSFSVNEGIMRSLHAAGHNITVISPFPSVMKTENFTNIDSRVRTFFHTGQNNIQDFYDLSLTQIYEHAIEYEMLVCRDVMELPAIKEALRSTEKLYDVMFVEILMTLMTYKCYLPIAERLDIPVIGSVITHSRKLADDIVGFSSNPVVSSLEFSSFDRPRNIVQKLKNLWNNAVIAYHFKPMMTEAVEQFHRIHFPFVGVLYTKDVSMIFYNNHASLLARATPPNAVEIGGIHLTPAKQLTENLQTFIDEAPHGVILFTFGATFKASSMQPQQRDAFLEAFKSIPQRVIWKFEESIENLPKNIMVLDWVPQRDILEHKNVIAFISNCGIGSVYEAMVTGTPVVAIPIAFDQPSNAALLRRRGVGVSLDLKTVTKEKVLAALNIIVNDTSYRQRMQELSSVFNDRPMTPQEQVVYWTEYVVRHDGARYMKPFRAEGKPPYKRLMWYIVAASCLPLVIFTIFAMYRMTRKLFSFAKNRSRQRISVRKNQ